MIKSLLSLKLTLFTISFFLLSVFNSFAQFDDARFDRIPEWYYKLVLPKIYNPLAVVTINDYDNFNMGVDYSEGHISTNPLNPLQFFNAFNTNGTHYTLDGGLNWIINNPAFPNAAGDPVTAYDSLGNLYYETMKSPVSACWVAKSTNNGQSWVWTNVSATTGNDKNWLACDQTAGPYANYVYTIMTNSTGGGATLARSTDFGATFTNMVTLSPHSLPGAMVAVGPNGDISGGCVYAVTHSGSNAAGVYTFFVSTNGGANFTQSSQLSVSNVIGTEISGRSTVSGMRNRPYPMIAADNSWGPYRGRLYLVWASNLPAGSGNKSDIFLKYSTDKGVTWSNTVTVNDDANTVNNYQFFPAIWTDKQTGKLYIKWYDTRNCPTSDSMDVYATYSTDGGQTFAQNQRITNKIFKIKLASSGSAPAYQGDYDAITSNSKVGMALWADFRNNNYGSYSAYFPDFGMRLNKTSDSINSVNGNINIKMVVPSTKLYTDTVLVSATISPTPSSGSFAINYPSVNGNKLFSYPDSLIVNVIANNVTSGIYTLTVKANGPNGTPVHTRTATIIANTLTSVTHNETPLSFSLSQNYPNPFNPVTRIDYSIAKVSNVKISIYDILGKEITSFKEENQNPGNHFVMFKSANLSSGVYYYKIEAGDFVDMKKMLLIK